MCWCVCQCVKHLLIPVDKATVAQSYYLNTKRKQEKKGPQLEQDKQIYDARFITKPVVGQGQNLKIRSLGTYNRAYIMGHFPSANPL